MSYRVDENLSMELRPNGGPKFAKLLTPSASTRRRRKGPTKRRSRPAFGDQFSVRSAVWTRRSSLRLGIGLPDYWIAINVRWLRQQGGCSLASLLVDCQRRSVSMRPSTDSAATLALLVTCLTMTSFLHTGEQYTFLIISNGCTYTNMSHQ